MNRIKMMKITAVILVTALIAGGSWLAWRQSRRDRAQEYFLLALKASQEGQADHAMTLLYAALELDRGLYQAYSLLGWHHLHRENWKKAEEMFLKAVRTNPRSKQDWFLLGEVYYRQGRLRPFLMAVSMARQVDPEYPNPYLQRALMHYDLNLYELALGDVLKVLEFDPDNQAAEELKELIIQKVSGEEEGLPKEMKYFRIQE